MKCQKNCRNYEPEPKHSKYERFHIDRITRILNSGYSPARIPQNPQSYNMLTIDTIEKKVNWIASSMYELGINISIDRDADIKRLFE